MKTNNSDYLVYMLAIEYWPIQFTARVSLNQSLSTITTASFIEGRRTECVNVSKI